MTDKQAQQQYEISMVGHELAWELVKTFLAARFSSAERHRRRLSKVEELENKETR